MSVAIVSLWRGRCRECDLVVYSILLTCTDGRYIVYNKGGQFNIYRDFGVRDLTCPSCTEGNIPIVTSMDWFLRTGIHDSIIISGNTVDKEAYILKWLCGMDGIV